MTTPQHGPYPPQGPQHGPYSPQNHPNHPGPPYNGYGYGYVPYRVPGPDDFDHRTSTAPLIATVLLTVLGPAALFLGGLSVMATDSCGSDCPTALTTWLYLIYGTIVFGGVLSLAALVTAWSLPRKVRYWNLRRWAAFITVAPSVLVIALVCTIPSP
ncbi:hypothetical protein [Streptomyces sp. ID05-47C]|uniref:hypothetical protein n=1 Tax=Streptomyces sp. ID05-47C TaxID=3028665 RepID=UPI0029AEC5C9|nr:hypothetical protein [Streptomyces sp. ID05-47C]MDX3573430.1 hypothetical protein [Streptomyces sp. ID05-47C]